VRLQEGDDQHVHLDCDSSLLVTDVLDSSNTSVYPGPWSGRSQKVADKVGVLVEATLLAAVS